MDNKNFRKMIFSIKDEVENSKIWKFSINKVNKSIVLLGSLKTKLNA